jgi:hypothetical protein
MPLVLFSSYIPTKFSLPSKTPEGSLPHLQEPIPGLYFQVDEYSPLCHALCISSFPFPFVPLQRRGTSEFRMREIQYTSRDYRHSHMWYFFFPIPVCAITASGVPGGTFASMNRFSALCGWLAQRQGWRVKGEYDRVSKRDRLGLTPGLTTRDLWRSRRWVREGKWEFCLFIPVGLQEFFYMP